MSSYDVVPLIAIIMVVLGVVAVVVCAVREGCGRDPEDSRDRPRG